MVSIQDFRDAWADRANRDAAFAIAEQYVAENEATLAPILAGKSSDELVKMIDLAKLAGNRELADTIKLWELVKFERRHIGGTLRKVLDAGPALRKVN